MDDCSAGAELVYVIGHTVIKASAHSNNQITAVHDHVGLVGAMHTEHAKKLRIRPRVRTEPHQGVGYREVQQSRQLGEVLTAIAQNDPAASVDYRATRLHHLVNSLANLPGMTTGHRRVGTHFDFLRVLVRHLDQRAGLVLRNIDQHRPRAPGGGNIEGLFHHLGNIFRVSYREAVFHDRPAYTHHIGFLKGVITDPVGTHLPGKHYHGNRIHISSSNTRYCIGSTGTRGHQHHSRLARRSGVAVCRMGRRLLVTH